MAVDARWLSLERANSLVAHCIMNVYRNMTPNAVAICGQNSKPT